MVRKFFITLHLLSISILFFSSEPTVECKYIIHDGINSFYLEMEIDEVILLLGKPKEVETVHSDDQLHKNDLICWKYNGIELSFYDCRVSSIITKIALPEGKNNFMIGKVKLHETAEEDILGWYGIPDFEKIKEQARYIQYDIVPFRKFPYTFILQFKINKAGRCSEVIFQRDDF